MLEAIALDSRSMIIKADTEREFSDVLTFISHKGKLEAVDKLLDLGRKNCVIDSHFLFNRDELYE